MTSQFPNESSEDLGAPRWTSKETKTNNPNKTFPEAQRIQAIETVAQVIFLTRILTTKHVVTFFIKPHVETVSNQTDFKSLTLDLVPLQRLQIWPLGVNATWIAALRYNGMFVEGVLWYHTTPAGRAILNWWWLWINGGCRLMWFINWGGLWWVVELGLGNAWEGKDVTPPMTWTLTMAGDSVQPTTCAQRLISFTHSYVS